MSNNEYTENHKKIGIFQNICVVNMWLPCQKCGRGSLVVCTSSFWMVWSNFAKWWRFGNNFIIMRSPKFWDQSGGFKPYWYQTQIDTIFFLKYFWIITTWKFISGYIHNKVTLISMGLCLNHFMLHEKEYLEDYCLLGRSYVEFKIWNA